MTLEQLHAKRESMGGPDVVVRQMKGTHENANEDRQTPEKEDLKVDKDIPIGEETLELEASEDESEEELVEEAREQERLLKDLNAKDKEREGECERENEEKAEKKARESEKKKKEEKQREKDLAEELKQKGKALQVITIYFATIGSSSLLIIFTQDRRRGRSLSTSSSEDRKRRSRSADSVKNTKREDRMRVIFLFNLFFLVVAQNSPSENKTIVDLVQAVIDTEHKLEEELRSDVSKAKQKHDEVKVEVSSMLNQTIEKLDKAIKEKVESFREFSKVKCQEEAAWLLFHERKI
uniref:Cilia- and flagella-associated protein 251-like n=1 Tax=Heterorhabditis bacteriophora TaxID=37862 RepID=A0A1I7XDA8_HETBA